MSRQGGRSRRPHSNSGRARNFGNYGLPDCQSAGLISEEQINEDRYCILYHLLPYIDDIDETCLNLLVSGRVDADNIYIELSQHINLEFQGYKRNQLLNALQRLYCYGQR
ncbi:MAG: hypothetical protein F6K41_24195 [Symploca sp. SIO3E6]|nr:hypothetical protein [Caldora sp. SIO3E6]